ncbi:MAG: glycerate kinase [Limnochordales bacterium]
MRIVIAPDSFKGSLSAADAAAALARGMAAVFPRARIMLKPVADGGEGTVEALVTATGGRFVDTEATGPDGRPVRARWGILGDGVTAVVEVAAASGLVLVPRGRRNPLTATSRGTGELIRAALDAGCRRIIVGLGGSATNDGGAGMARALGARFLDAAGRELPPGGAALSGLDRIDVSGLDPRLAETEIIGATDVTSPLLGPAGASAVFGPQKGASPEDVLRLEAALTRYADVLEKQLREDWPLPVKGLIAADSPEPEQSKTAAGPDLRHVPGAGAAGGLGVGLMAFCGATLRPGAPVVFEAIGLEADIKHASLVITGEGKLDGQTAFGKAPMAVAQLAKKHGKPVVAVAGTLGGDVERLHELGIDAVMATAPGPIPWKTSLQQAPRLLEETGRRLARLLRVGMILQGREDVP